MGCSVISGRFTLTLAPRLTHSPPCFPNFRQSLKMVNAFINPKVYCALRCIQRYAPVSYSMDGISRERWITVIECSRISGHIPRPICTRGSDRCDYLDGVQNRHIFSYASQSAVHFWLNVRGLRSQGGANDYKFRPL